MKLFPLSLIASSAFLVASPSQIAYAQMDKQYDQQQKDNRSDFKWCISKYDSALFLNDLEPPTRLTISKDNKVWKLYKYNDEYGNLRCIYYLEGYLNKEWDHNGLDRVMWKLEKNMLIKYFRFTNMSNSINKHIFKMVGSE